MALLYVLLSQSFCWQVRPVHDMSKHGQARQGAQHVKNEQLEGSCRLLRT